MIVTIENIVQAFNDLESSVRSRVYRRKQQELQEQLEAFFPTTTFSTLNAGVSGGSTAQALGRLQRDVIRHQPDLVLIAFGLNDSTRGLEKIDAFADDLRKIVKAVRGQTEADVVLLTPPYMATKPTERIHPDHEGVTEIILRAQRDGALAAYAENIRCVASELAVPVADIHAEWKRLSESGTDTDLWLCNGLNHPDARGHQLAATVVFHTLLNGRPT